MPPQMYFVLENHPKLESILKKQKLKDNLFIHDHTNIYYDNLAFSVRKIEETEEFKKIHEKNKENEEFKDIMF